MDRTKIAIGFGRDLGRLDLAATPPEDIRIRKVDARLPQMLVDRRLVREHRGLLHAVGDGHDVDPVKLRSALAPIRMRDHVVTPYLAAGLDLPPGRNGPMEERVVARGALVSGRGFHVFEEGRESSDDSALVQRSRDRDERCEVDPSLARARLPEIAHDL